MNHNTQQYRNRITIRNTFVPSAESGDTSPWFWVKLKLSKRIQGHFSSSSFVSTCTTPRSFSLIWFPMNSTCFGLLACLDRIAFVFSGMQLWASRLLSVYLSCGLPTTSDVFVPLITGSLRRSILTWLWTPDPNYLQNEEKEAIHIWDAIIVGFFCHQSILFCLLQCSPANSR